MGLTNAKITAILNDYDKRRYLAEQELKNRYEEVSASVPRFKEIDDEIHSLCVLQSKKQITNAEEITASEKESYQQQLAALEQEKQSLLRQHDYPDDFLSLTYTCEFCKDTGYIKTEGSSRAVKCRCLSQIIIKVLYDQSGIIDTIQHENFNTFTDRYYPDDLVVTPDGKSARDFMNEVVAQCKTYIKDFPRFKGNMLFRGKAGLGKTFLSNCIASELINQLYSVVYLTALQLFDIFSQYDFGDDGKQYEEAISHLLSCDLLIIDDLGSEVDNRFTNTKLFYVISERLNRQKGTIISTNLSSTEIRDRYSDRVYSRIIGNYKPVTFLGRDIRIAKLKQSL